MESLILLVVIGGFFYFAMIAPQRRKVKAHRQLINSLQDGDEVVTNAGIYGAVAEVEDSFIWLEVAPEVELKIQKNSIVSRVSEEEPPEESVSDEETDGEDESK